MNRYILMLTSMIAGYGMGLVSVTLGACIMSKAMKSGGLFPEYLEPKGDVFNVETPEDMALFPEDIVNKAEEHVLAKTNRFLESFNAPVEDK
jgi:hypothetical protein